MPSVEMTSSAFSSVADPWRHRRCVIEDATAEGHEWFYERGGGVGPRWSSTIMILLVRASWIARAIRLNTLRPPRRMPTEPFLVVVIDIEMLPQFKPSFKSADD
jgi:hypothetical protein